MLINLNSFLVHSLAPRTHRNI